MAPSKKLNLPKLLQLKCPRLTCLKALLSVLSLMQCYYTGLLTFMRMSLAIFFLPHKCSLQFVVSAVCSPIATTITLCSTILGFHRSGSHASSPLFQKLSGFTNSVCSIDISTQSEVMDPSSGLTSPHGSWLSCAALHSAASGHC